MKIKKTFVHLIAGIMVLSSFAHIYSPELYDGMVPPFLPVGLSHILAFVVELAIGIALFVPRFRSLAGLAFMVLMLVFLPIHIWDATRENPVIGSRAVAYIRIGIQLFLILLGFFIFKTKRKKVF